MSRPPAPATHHAAHLQHGFDRRFDWGLAGARALAPHVAALVVVDVLSFSTCVDVAVGRGASIIPTPQPDAQAAALARAHAAVLAGHRDDPAGGTPWTLSPAALRAIPAGTRLVLPSPNGATICAEAAALGVRMLCGCLRNATAVAALAAAAGSVAVIAAGERWPDGSLRPALEDVVGAGAILQALGGAPSPEARAAIALAATVGDVDLRGCASARELVERGFAADVELALEREVSTVAPLLVARAFADGSATMPV